MMIFAVCGRVLIDDISMYYIVCLEDERLLLLGVVFRCVLLQGDVCLEVCTSVRLIRR